MQTKQEVLKACKIHGFVVTLPPIQLERNLYQEVAKHIGLIGGKWDRKNNGFLFKENPEHLFKQICNDEKKNLKKEFQFFPTPETLADKMVKLANIQEYDSVLEPSAGQGAIIKAIQKLYPDQLVHYCELMELNRNFLTKIPNTQYLTDNFLKLSKIPILIGFFDKIIANPPFTKNQDIQHIYQMWDCLKEGGKIITVASKHWQYSNGKTETEFKRWLCHEIDANITDIEDGMFSESGTNISTVLIEINKPLN